MPLGVLDEYGSTLLATGSGASGTIFTYTVGSVVPIAASARLTNCVMPTAAVTIDVKKNGTIQFTITISNASIGAPGATGFNANGLENNVGTRGIGNLTAVATDVITFVLTGTLPGSTTVTAELWSTLPSKPIAVRLGGRLDWWRTHPACGQLNITAWPAQTTLVAQGNNFTLSPLCAPEQNSSMYYDAATGDLRHWPGIATREVNYNAGASLTRTYAYKLPGGAASAYHTVVANYSPIAYWRMNETSGTTMTDSSGNAHNGTYSASGITYSVTGQADGTAITFDGVNGIASAALDLSAKSHIVVAFLAKIAAFANDDKLLVDFNDAGDGGWYAAPDDSASGKFEFGLHKTTGGYNSVDVVRPSAAAWHLYVIDYNIPATGGIKVTPFIDGVPQGYVNNNTGATSGNFLSDTVRICQTLAGAASMAATMQHLCIFDGATTDVHKLAGDLMFASGLTAITWQAAGKTFDLIASDAATGLNDQSGYVADAYPFVDLSGNKCLLCDTADDGGVGDSGAYTRWSLKMWRSTGNWDGPWQGPATLYSRLRSSSPTGAEAFMIPRAGTSDYVLLIGCFHSSAGGPIDNRFVRAIVLASLPSTASPPATQAISDATFNAGTTVLYNNEETGGIAIVGNNLVYVTWQIPSRLDVHTAQRVYTAPIAGCDDPTQWCLWRDGGISFWGVDLVTNTQQDGGYIGASNAIYFNPVGEAWYITATVNSKTDSLNRVVWSKAQTYNLFKSSVAARLAGVTRHSIGAASILEVPLQQTTTLSVTFTLRVALFDVAIVLGSGPTSESVLISCIIYTLTTTGWTIQTFDAAGTSTTQASGATPAAVVGTSITFELDRSSNTYTGKISGATHGTFTVTDATLLTQLNGANARWMLYVDPGQQIDVTDITLTQTGTGTATVPASPPPWTPLPLVSPVMAM